MSYDYVQPDEFTPESRINWITVGKVTKWTQEEEGIVDKFTLFLDGGLKVYIYFLSHNTFRVRFNPDPNAPYVKSRSPATEVERIEASKIKVKEEGGCLSIATDKIEVRVNLKKYALSVYRSGQLVHADPVDYNLVYVDRQYGEAVAQFKMAPTNSQYYGFGEKAGATVDKRRVPKQHFYGQLAGGNEKIGATMTFFNFDNFGYTAPDLTPEGEVQGPLNPNSPLYQSSPFLIEFNPSPDGAFDGPSYANGILLDNTSQTFVNFRQGDQYYFGALYGELDYYFFAGDHVAEVLNEFTQLTGRTQLKPKHVFGYQQGGYGPNYNEKWKLLEVALKYRQWKIPIDGLHVDVDIQDNYRTFTHSKIKFPNPKEMFDALHDWGFKCSTNITPIISCNTDENGEYSPYKALDTGKANGMFVINTREDGSGTHDPYIGNVNYGRGHLTWGHYPDLGRQDVQKWWGEQYRDLLDWGLDFVWQDMTTPAMKASVHQPDCALLSFPMDIMITDNEETRYSKISTHQDKKPFAKIRCLFNYNLCKATYHGLQRLQPKKRHFIIARGGFVGVHRYAGLWTGDSTSNWEFIQMNIPLVLGIGLSAQPVSGCDIGGFCAAFPGQIVDSEMLCRWTIMGAFLPWFRNHYDNYAKPYQEPYRYPEPVPTICRKYIEIRYKLIQYIYDAMYENSRCGKPICRPLFMDEIKPGEFHNDPYADDEHGWGYNGYASNRLDDQFFLGKDILVAPIVNPGQKSRAVYLPSGSQWYRFTDDEMPLDAPVDGGAEFDFYAPWDDPSKDNCAVYVREGAIIPKRELEQYIGELYSQGKMNPVTFTVYPGRDSKYLMYLDDDGVTNSAEKEGKYRLTQISHQGIPGGQKIRINRTYDKFKPPETFYYLSMPGTITPQYVRAAGKALQQKTGASNEEAAKALADSKDTPGAYYYNNYLNTTFIKIFDTSSDITVEVVF